MNLAEVDLAELVSGLADSFAGRSVVGFVRGRTALRDAVAARLGCSQLEAEDLVETMVSLGFVRYLGDSTSIADSDERWTLDGGRAG